MFYIIFVQLFETIRLRIQTLKFGGGSQVPARGTSWEFGNTRCLSTRHDCGPTAGVHGIQFSRRP